MAKRSRLQFGKWWIPLVAVLVVALAGFTVYKLNGVFGSQDVTSTASGAADQIVPFNPKRIDYEVFGAPGATADINYLDYNGQPHRVDDAALPWTLQAVTTQPSVFVNLIAQGDGAYLGCRIKVDGVVKDERFVQNMNAYTSCLDKSG